MKSFTEQQYIKLDELGGVGMPLRHALLAVGVSDSDLDEAARDKAACATGIVQEHCDWRRKLPPRCC